MHDLSRAISTAASTATSAPIPDSPPDSSPTDGAPAPDAAFRFRQGAGRLSLDFIRTLRHRGNADAVEELAQPADLAAWVAQCGPCDVDPVALSSEFGQAQDSESRTAGARDLREAIFVLVRTARSPEGVASSDQPVRDVVNRAAALPVPTPVLDAAARLHWRADDPVSATLALIARDALDLVTSAAITQVRDCANPTCGAQFCDTSRPGNRRWCSMGVCGNQAKKNTFRSKGKGAVADAPALR